MPRDREKKVELKTVDDESEPFSVVRLGPAKHPPETDPPIRLGPVKTMTEAPQAGHDMPRSYASKQPDFVDLIDARNHAGNPLGEESMWGEESRSGKFRPWGWFFLAGCILTAAVIWSLISVKKADKVIAAIRNQTIEILEDEAAQQKEAERLINDMESVMRRFFTSTTIENRLRWVRFPERVAPMMEDYHKDHPLLANPLQKVRSLQPLPIDFTNQFWMATVLLASGDVQELILECTEKGPRVDWETMVYHQPMSWDEFATGRPAARSVDFRLYVHPGVFYSHAFANENEWACYRLSAPHEEQVMFGYVRRGSGLANELEALTKSSGRASLILRLRIPEALNSPMGVLIEKIISPRWLLVTLPEEDI